MSAITPTFGSPVAATISCEITRPLNPGEVHRLLLRASHDLAVASRREAAANLVCERLNRDLFLPPLADMAQEAAAMAGPEQKLGDLTNEPLRKVMLLAVVKDGRWIARERAKAGSTVVLDAEEGVYPERIVLQAKRLSEAWRATRTEAFEQRTAYGFRVIAEDRVTNLRDELRRARCRSWSEALKTWAAVGGVSFLAQATVAIVQTPGEPPIGGSGQPVPGGTAGHPVLFLTLGIAVVAAAASAVLKKLSRIR